MRWVGLCRKPNAEIVYSHILSYSTRMVWISPWPRIANPQGVPLAFIDFCATRSCFYSLYMPTYFRFEFRHIQPPLEPNFNRLVCSRVYSLSTLNLFIVCSLIYLVILSLFLCELINTFFYCRISAPLGTWTRTTQIKSLVLYHWASGAYGGLLFRRDNEFLRIVCYLRPQA